jgi:hypothetical protein
MFDITLHLLPGTDGFGRGSMDYGGWSVSYISFMEPLKVSGHAILLLFCCLYILVIVLGLLQYL